MRTQMMRDASYLLPDPGGEVVRSCLDEIERLRDAQRQLTELREAVVWERECCQDIRPLTAWADLYVRHGEDYVDGVAEDLRATQDAARAEVDRLLEEK